MASADAKEANEKYDVKVVFGDGKRAFWNEVFEGNPRVSNHKDLLPNEQFCWVANFPSHRPYIETVENGRIFFKKDFKAKPGEIYLSDVERDFAKKSVSGKYILIEPNVKAKWIPGTNKDWGWKNWLEVIKSDYQFVQCGKSDSPRLPGVRFIETRRFRDAVAVLENAALLITTDGGLHHAAAAMNIPAVVIWGGLASPKNLGYDSHINLWSGAEPCGRFKVKCPHCREALDSISAREVINTIGKIL